MADTQISSIKGQNRTAEPFYPLSPSIPNLMPRAFMFGRRRVVRSLPFPIEKRANILEVGCGSGHNLRQLARWFPNAMLTGIDSSSQKIERAGRNTDNFWKRIELKQEPYLSGIERFRGRADAILFSYTLSGKNAQWRPLILQAQESLRPGGFIAVVDFHNSRFPWIKAQMGNRQVRMDGQLLSFLNEEFEAVDSCIRPAYGGLWEYFSFVGRKR